MHKSVGLMRPIAAGIRFFFLSKIDGGTYLYARVKVLKAVWLSVDFNQICCLREKEKLLEQIDANPKL